MDSSSSYVDLHETLEIDSDDLRIYEENNDLTTEKSKSNNEYTIVKEIDQEREQIKEKENTDECQSEPVVNDGEESLENNHFSKSNSNIEINKSLKVEQISENINSSDQSFNSTDTSNYQNSIEDERNLTQKVCTNRENILSLPEEQNFEQQVSSNENMMLENKNKMNGNSENFENYGKVKLELNCSSIVDKNIAKDDVLNLHNTQQFENNEKNDETEIEINQTQSIMLEKEKEKYECLNSEEIEQKPTEKDQNEKYNVEFDEEEDQQYSVPVVKSITDVVKNEKITHAKYLEDDVHIFQKFDSVHETEENKVPSRNDRSQIKIDDITEFFKDQTEIKNVKKKEHFKENEVYSSLNDLNSIVEKSNESSIAVEKEKIEEHIEFMHDKNEIDNQNMCGNDKYSLKKEFKSFSENSIQYVTKQEDLQLQRTIDEKCESDNSVNYSFSEFVHEMRQSKRSDSECQKFSDMIIDNDKDAIKNNNLNITEKQELKIQQSNRLDSLLKSNQKINPKRMENVSNFQKKLKKDVNDANIDTDFSGDYNLSSENPDKDEINEEQIVISKKQTETCKIKEMKKKEILPTFLAVDELQDVDKMSNFGIENEKTDDFHITEKSVEFDLTKSEKMDFNFLDFEFSQLQEAPIEFYNNIEDRTNQHFQKKNTNISTNTIFGGNETTTEIELQDDVNQTTDKSISKDSDQKMRENEKRNSIY